MTTIVTRAGKGSPLTWNEVDTNFTNLNSAKYESGNNATFGTIGGTTITASTGFSGALNGTVGASTPAAGTFTSLSYSSTLTGGTGVVNLGSGQFYKDASGNVGIGTSSPGARLQVLSPGGWSAANWGKGFYVNTSGSACNPAIGISDASGSNNWAIVNLSGALQFATGPAITDSSTAGAPRMTIDSSGNVMIGTTTPRQALTVAQGNSAGMGLEISNLNTGSNTTKYSQLEFSGYDTVGTYKPSAQIQAVPADNNYVGAYLAFTTRGSDAVAERMRIDSSGNVLVGTTSAINGGHVIYKSNSSGLALTVKNSGTTDGYVLDVVSSTAAGTGYTLIRGFNSNTTLSFIVLGNGNVQNTNNSYGAISDITLKENITDATPKLNDLCNVKIRNFNLIEDKSKTKQIGVIAQELEEIFPSMIDVNSDGIKSVKYSVFVPILVKAIQEQQELIKQLQADVALLKGN